MHEQLVEQCFKGRRELSIYPARVDLALGDSEFNRKELEALGFSPTGVLPVVPDFSHLDLPPNDLIAQEFDDDWTNIVFVGRVIPNKRIEDVIRYFHAYQRHFNPRSRLLLVGSYGGFDKYLAMLQQLAARLGVTNVHFAGHVSDAELSAYYDVADSSCARRARRLLRSNRRIVTRGFLWSRTASAVKNDGRSGCPLYDPGSRWVAALIDAVIDDEVCERVVRKQDERSGVSVRRTLMARCSDSTRC